MGLFNFFSGFIVGAYSALYVAKHYDLPAVPDPSDLVDRLKKITEQYKKDN